MQLLFNDLVLGGYTESEALQILGSNDPKVALIDTWLLLLRSLYSYVSVQGYLQDSSMNPFCFADQEKQRKDRCRAVPTGKQMNTVKIRR
jgi:hypothetical protein